MQRYHSFALVFWMINLLFLSPRFMTANRLLCLTSNYPNKWTVSLRTLNVYNLCPTLSMIKECRDLSAPTLCYTGKRKTESVKSWKQKKTMKTFLLLCLLQLLFTYCHLSRNHPLLHTHIFSLTMSGDRVCVHILLWRVMDQRCANPIPPFSWSPWHDSSSLPLPHNLPPFHQKKIFRIPPEYQLLAHVLMHQILKIY